MKLSSYEAGSYSLIAEGLEFPEGPVWLPDHTLAVVEVAAGRIARIDPSKSIVDRIATGGGPNGAALGPDGLLYVCNNGGFTFAQDAHEGLKPIGAAPDFVHGWIERVDLERRTVERLFDRSPRGLLRGPNDLQFDGDGGFWFTDFGKVRVRDMDRGCLCYVPPDLAGVVEVIAPLITPNGVGLSPDGQTVYVSETVTARLWAFALSGPGEIVAKSGPLHPNGGLMLFCPGEYQRMDSMAVDAEGFVSVATPFPGGIDVVSPDGILEERILFPGEVVTNICFGGADLRTAYITLSGSGKLVAIPWPRAGVPLFA